MGKRCRRCVLAWSLLSALMAGAAGAAETGGHTIANQDVVDMARAGLSDELIEDTIRSNGNDFDMSPRAMIALKDAGVSERLIQLMRSEAARRREDPSARVLAELANVSSDRPEERRAAAEYFAANAEGVRPALRLALGNPAPETRAAAAVALGRIGDGESLGKIREMLDDPAPAVRQAAANSLAAMNDRVSVELAEKIALGDNAGFDRDRRLDGHVRLLGYGKSLRSVGGLGKILSSNPDVSVRQAAAWSLGEIGAAEGRPALERALSGDMAPAVRREAALALAKAPGPTTLSLLEDSCRVDTESRRTILAALANFPGAVGFLVEAVAQGPEMLAADEIEIARASLVRLTGQDFGSDGGRWTAWHEANRRRTQNSSAGYSGGSFPNEVDLEAWTILQDTAKIPMAAGLGGDAGAQPVPTDIPLLPVTEGFSGEGVATTTLPPSFPPASGGVSGGEDISRFFVTSGTSAPPAPGGAVDIASPGATWVPAGTNPGEFATVPEEIPLVPIPGTESAAAAPNLRAWSPADRAEEAPGAVMDQSPGALSGQIPGWARENEPVRASMPPPVQVEPAETIIAAPPAPLAVEDAVPPWFPPPVADTAPGASSEVPPMLPPSFPPPEGSFVQEPQGSGSVSGGETVVFAPPPPLSGTSGVVSPELVAPESALPGGETVVFVPPPPLSGTSGAVSPESVVPESALSGPPASEAVFLSEPYELPGTSAAAAFPFVGEGAGADLPPVPAGAVGDAGVVDVPTFPAEAIGEVGVADLSPFPDGAIGESPADGEPIAAEEVPVMEAPADWAPPPAEEVPVEGAAIIGDPPAVIQEEAVSSPPSFAQPGGELDSQSFFDPSAPLPPVRPEGMLQGNGAPPPTLGEGLF